MHPCVLITETTFRGGPGHMWTRSFHCVNTHVSWATYEEPPTQLTYLTHCCLNVVLRFLVSIRWLFVPTTTISTLITILWLIVFLDLKKSFFIAKLGAVHLFIQSLLSHSISLTLDNTHKQTSSDTSVNSNCVKATSFGLSEHKWQWYLFAQTGQKSISSRIYILHNLHNSVCVWANNYVPSIVKWRIFQLLDIFSNFLFYFVTLCLITESLTLASAFPLPRWLHVPPSWVSHVSCSCVYLNTMFPSPQCQSWSVIFVSVWPSFLFDPASLPLPDPYWPSVPNLKTVFKLWPHVWVWHLSLPSHHITHLHVTWLSVVLCYLKTISCWCWHWPHSNSNIRSCLLI